jgi:hypothetical protein
MIGPVTGPGGGNNRLWPDQLPPSSGRGCREGAHHQRHDQRRQTDQDQDADGEDSAESGHKGSGDRESYEQDTKDHDDLRAMCA